MTDPIADMFVRIKNALRLRAETVDIPYSGVKEKIGEVLLNEGFIEKQNVLSRMKKKILRITLKYSETKKSPISEIKRASRPGRRIYVRTQKIPCVQSGFGMAILSTTQGILSDAEARKRKLGGEVLAYVW